MATYVINLDRGQERLSSVSNLLKMLELDFTRVPAVNGRELLLRGGRARCKSKFVWRLTYTEGKDRVTHLVRPGKLASCGAVDFWAQHGRARSHFNALKSLVAQSSHRYTLVLEDDVVLPFGFDSRSLWERLSQVCRYLNECHAGWVGVMLGAAPLLCATGGNSETDLEGLYAATRAVQAHAILWHRGSATSAVLESVQQKLTLVLVADNALAAVMKVHPGMFYVKPAALIQNSKVPSSLQLVGGAGGKFGYQQAARSRKSSSSNQIARAGRAKLPKPLRSALGSHRRGVRPIAKAALKKQRCASGAQGGQAAAGHGSCSVRSELVVSLCLDRWRHAGVKLTKGMTDSCTT